MMRAKNRAIAIWMVMTDNVKKNVLRNEIKKYLS